MYTKFSSTSSISIQLILNTQFPVESLEAGVIRKSTTDKIARAV